MSQTNHRVCTTANPGQDNMQTTTICTSDKFFSLGKEHDMQTESRPRAVFRTASVNTNDKRARVLFSRDESIPPRANKPHVAMAQETLRQKRQTASQCCNPSPQTGHRSSVCSKKSNQEDSSRDTRVIHFDKQPDGREQIFE